jgi:hypothetical protein
MFLFPAMGHCAGGDGPNDFPLLAALMAWVETGTAPEVLVAERAIGGQGAPPEAGPQAIHPQLQPRSRPVYAYPAVARYSGKGSINEAASFTRRLVRFEPARAQWLGARP